jgi:hypothetical protein
MVKSSKGGMTLWVRILAQRPADFAKHALWNRGQEFRLVVHGAAAASPSMQGAIAARKP